MIKRESIYKRMLQVKVKIRTNKRIHRKKRRLHRSLFKIQNRSTKQSKNKCKNQRKYPKTNNSSTNNNSNNLNRRQSPTNRSTKPKQSKNKSPIINNKKKFRVIKIKTVKKTMTITVINSFNNHMNSSTKKFMDKKKIKIKMKQK